MTMKHYNQKEEWDKKALEYMEGCLNILDIACGEGRFISHSPRRISGVDYNGKAVSKCWEKGYDVILSQATYLSRIKDSLFDAVHCSHLIEHLEPRDAYQLLSEIDRVLKVKGIVCIRAPLLHKYFYNNLTHVKPYDPGAILHYLKTEKQHDRTMGELPCLYEVLALEYRKMPLFLRSRLKWLQRLGNDLQRLGISTFRKNGYMLVLRKLK